MKIAIYSRKSKFTGKGESIENQIEICKEYAITYFNNIDEVIIYEDEGFSGGTTDRPQFQQMLKDAKDKKFNVLICYRLNRISRNVADFSSLIQMLQDNNIEFVSVREQFDTSTAMGRAMMNISAVFAQLERETIAEQVKDNMLHLATTGRWLGGVPPLGFESEKVLYIDKDFKERTLTILKPVKKEMDLAKFFYDKYLELGSIHQLRKYLIQNNYKTRNGKYYSSRAISDILRNPAYVMANNKVVEYLEDKGIEVAGKEKLNDKKAILIYNKVNKKGIQRDYDDWIAAIAKHDGTISSDKWLKVQKQLDKNSMDIPRTGTSEIALLSGLVKCAKCGSAMNVMYGRKRKDGSAPHYYVCHLKTVSGMDKCNNSNANGTDTDYTVINKILELADSEEKLLQLLKKNKGDIFHQNYFNTIKEYKNRHKELLEEIDVLVNELPKSPTASKYILPQIEAKDKEVKEIEKEIKKLEKTSQKAKKENDNLNFVVNNIIQFANMMDKLDNAQKKYFIKTIVDKVYWDGEREEVGIKLFLDKDINVSKFYPTTSTAWNKTGMVLYEDLKEYPRYQDYPENTLGQRIRKHRFLNGLTAKELADKMGYSENSIYAYESDNAIPGKKAIEDIANILGVNIEYLQYKKDSKDLP